jgi:hypothetical protein
MQRNRVMDNELSESTQNHGQSGLLGIIWTGFRHGRILSPQLDKQSRLRILIDA